MGDSESDGDSESGGDSRSEQSGFLEVSKAQVKTVRQVGKDCVALSLWCVGVNGEADPQVAKSERCCGGSRGGLLEKVTGRF